jgi:tRNA pseudouridine32 synthase / 23S rRNA pseudouridine746 synthase
VTVGLVLETLSTPDSTIPPTAGTQTTTTKKQKVETDIHKEDHPPSNTLDDPTTIPESVLTYERHLRKIQASQRSVADLSMKEHLRVVYEDSDVIVVDKPSGVLCVPGINDKPNLLQLVCQYMSEQTTTKVEARSEMIAHRLDMDTSGLVVFCKNTMALKTLQASFRDRTVTVKEYHAQLCGHLPHEWTSGSIHLPLQRDHRHPPFMRVATPRSEAEAQEAVKDLQTHGFKKLVKKRPKPSHTEFRILERDYLEYPNVPLVEDPTTSSTGMRTDDNVMMTPPTTTIRIPVTRVALTPHTGRTHQLRVHCAAMGYPIVGDPAYGLYGEAQARGGVDAETNTRWTTNDDNPQQHAPAVGASMDLQRNLARCRPSHSYTMCLHAAKLGIDHPISGEPMLWTAPTPF